jgi:large subunit ribosomal protein L5
MNRLTQRFNDEAVSKLMERFNYSSVMECPRLEKIVINMGVGDAIANPKALEEAVEHLTLISGQKPVINKAKKSIANFKLREGMSIG